MFIIQQMGVQFNGLCSKMVFSVKNRPCLLNKMGYWKVYVDSHQFFKVLKCEQTCQYFVTALDFMTNCHQMIETLIII